jgi:hypothetical protein
MSDVPHSSVEAKTSPSQQHVPTITSEERKRYRQEEKEKGIRYCDLEKGWCLNVCSPNKTSCDQCLRMMNNFM